MSPARASVFFMDSNSPQLTLWATDMPGCADCVRPQPTIIHDASMPQFTLWLRTCRRLRRLCARLGYALFSSALKPIS